MSRLLFVIMMMLMVNNTWLTRKVEKKNGKQIDPTHNGIQNGWNAIIVHVCAALGNETKS